MRLISAWAASAYDKAIFGRKLEMNSRVPRKIAIPANAGIRKFLRTLDLRFREDDKEINYSGCSLVQ